MALKKSISKGASDKNKKKQVLEEIEQLTENLRLIQEKELKEFQDPSCGMESLSLNEDLPIESNDASIPQHQLEKNDKKPNRQEKRKQKKAQQMESLRMEAELEASMSVNTKEIEDRSIKSILDPLKLQIYEIPPDGHCLYSAISHQLDGNLDYKKIRKIASDYLQSHEQDFIPFMVNASGDSMTTQEFESYCIDVKESSTWGGQIELQALAMALDCLIHVYQADTPRIIIGEQDSLNSKKQTLFLSYHKHSYGLGEHYNSLIKME